ncbi:hypothetical protein G6F46_001091 [Rhizopus delemar]|uniref:Uncharacterized protein n=2 Tax=Rhizopus TaxID=4842 RepID=A0A9P6ZFG5_9FUNG|nr:hypothetical protein G6F55_003184 [Rhizopus delemar]KAG1552474.1 hypothetical protein G6F51_001212 [Rhizopus arrhizus]KAG1504433.1 hypothetical protein G6F54_000992 [Rhizopus delemar]KAG1518126.1 hypothetical protein G6F53_000844 [Rhizopus delemar]KAG1561117.1 hypothetical protein G6F49_002110 [Rhizopus delemar]
MQPQSLISNTVNPANLLEIQILSNIITELHSKNDIRGSIPYLAKIVQIIDNQKLERGSDKDRYYRQLNEYRKVQSRAHFDLGEAYFKTQDFISSEISLSIAVKSWEKLLKYENTVEFKKDLSIAYDYLKICYESMGKHQLAQYMESRKAKLHEFSFINKGEKGNTSL